MSKIIKDFDAYIKQLDLSQYANFRHGTTKHRAKQILKDGLKPKSDIKEGSSTTNIWGNSSESLGDRVYFTTCMESTQLPLTACEKAYEVDGKRAYMQLHSINYIPNNDNYGFSPFSKYDKIDDFHQKECAILQLKTPQKYTSHFVLDEDSKGIKPCLKRLFSDKTYKNYEISNCFSALRNIDDNILQYYEKAYVEGGEQLASQLIDKTPEALFSIIDWGTIGIKHAIDPQDLEEIDMIQYKQKSSCKKQFLNQKLCDVINPKGYCSQESKLYNAYNELVGNHTPDGIKQFKKQLSLLR